MAKILIIDDDEHVTRLLQSHFSDLGHAVTVSHRGEEGMAIALQTAPDLIFLDVMLPDATGFQLCTRLRKSTTTAGTPILMMTGVARFPNQQVFALERGANEYILKPFDIIEVGEMVDRYVHPKPPSSTPAPKKVVKPLPVPPPEHPTTDMAELSNFLRNAIQKSKLNH